MRLVALASRLLWLGLTGLGAPHLTLTCPSVPAPGRVICAIEAELDEGATLQWGDVVLISVPSFVSALRGRIGPHDASFKSTRRWRWSFALVAHGVGHGVLEARARVIACRGGACTPQMASVTGEVAVGP